MSYKRWVIIYILIAAIVILCSCKKAITQLDINISKDIQSAKEVVIVTLPVIKDKLNNRQVFISEINMELDKNHRGKISILYSDNDFNLDKVPNMIVVNVNTSENKINSLEEKTRDSKLYPGITEFEKWQIDSDKAIDIASELFEKSYGFNFDKIYLSTINYYDKNKEIWKVTLLDTQKNIAYVSRIDPYNGDVYSYEIKK